ncbi:MAG TPA: hypothetical protein VFR90_04310 [Methylibium sp.]|uniref:hypothetical protein n=1 Tax=Methylibium sp. TaxID=2067992 RepID=UPI002DB5DA9B|nr:hypothetical protein [Methylibium sp.]HEU4458324.1 hypothetical protein [Methylibium sp.]
MNRPSPAVRLACLGAFASIAAASAHAAGDVYFQGGFAGGGVGYALPLDARFGLRADVMTVGSRRDTYTDDDGVEYRGKLRNDRVALFGDFFPGAGGFRLSAGVGLHDARLDLSARGAGQVVTIGSRTLVLTAGDRFDVKIEYPRVMPYLGLGYGHHRAQPGWGFIFDVGLFFGRTKVSGGASGPGFAAAGLTQADVDAELQSIREDEADWRVLPQVTFGASYKF